MLSKILVRAENNNEFHGNTIAKNAPAISHLHNVDDFILFCRENLTEVNGIHQNLQKYFKWSGEHANLSKSCISFQDMFLLLQEAKFSLPLEFLLPLKV